MTAASAKKSSKMAPQKSPHPATSEMVIAAIKTLNEKKGSSLHAIKKYIAATYVVDAKKLAPFIKKYLKNSVEKETIVQTSGVGASGRFKVGGKSSVDQKPKKPVAIKPDGKKVKKNAAKSVATKPDSKKVKKSAATSIATKSGGKKVKRSDAKSIATKSGGKKVTKKRTGKSINKSLAKPKANKLVKSAKTKKLPATAKVAKPKLAKK